MSQLQELPQLQWYKVEVFRAHQGTGRSESTTAFIHAKNPVEVLDRYKRMPGVKRDLRTCHFPTALPLSEQEAVELEERIERERRVPLDVAKKTWYYDRFI